MGKLRMKRTAEEQAARDLRKAKRASRKSTKRAAKSAQPSESPSQNRPHTHWDNDSDDAGPSSRAYKVDYDRIQAEAEEARFREKMWGAFDDDERLDSVEASLNSYAHVPRRWRSGGMERMDDDFHIDPQMMEDEDYAEWVRMGMWRKTHAAEHAELLRKQQETADRLAREEAARVETRRLEKEAEAERKQRRRKRELQRSMGARVLYESRWKELLAPLAEEGPAKPLRFMDIPWPMFFQDLFVDGKSKDGYHFDLESISADAISAFLLPPERFPQRSADPTVKKERREKLMETMLRFHPDKFEGRVLSRVEAKDKEKTKEAVAKVAVILNGLIATGD